MARYLAYIGLILVLAPLESTVPRVVPFNGVHVLLLLPLVFFFALQLNTIEGLLLTYVAGFVEDATVTYTTGLSAFVLVALFVVARLMLATFRTDGPIFESLFSFGMAACFYAGTIGLRRVFEPGLAPFGEEWWSPYIAACVTTACVTPLVTFVARQIEKLQVKSFGTA